ncbi:hypothetical protein CANARDRAFT_204815 [[Candida] arabinofermentans NRRL YB-2248]|uniref:ASTRA-associated protein 1 n=1 Tax=[Candida] arabinofermentans NRRL YB-2248 TaxID=983967 RepID=A0A1E4SSZ6_9ASCO|nr:hypothetical protein CANARDRAFT_204815 [[Candida] arabinofermentans NRRL YB-2248]
MTPTLISVDESGWIIWWDITTKRPIGSWKGHNGNILTLKQLDHKWYGKILTHGKDGELVIWDLFTLIKLNSTSVTFRNSCPLQRKLFSDGENMSKWPMPKVIFRMPVNMMNFSNVDIQWDGIVVTPSTQDSNKLDIYRISIDEHQIAIDGGLKRLFKSVCPMEIIQRDGLDVKVDHIKNEEDTNGSVGGGQSKDLGIIMKIVWVSNTKFSVGYESGHVITYSLTPDNEKIGIFSICAKHYPNPIISLTYDQFNDRLISSSSSDMIVFDDLNYGILDVTSKVKVFKLKHKGVSDIKVRNIMVGFITWDGYARFYKYDEEKVLKFLFKLKKLVPSITPSINPTATSESDITETIDESLAQRASILNFTKIQKNHQGLKNDNNLIFNNGMSKNIIKKRDEINYDRNWLFIAYKDGRIVLYNTND